MPSPSHITTHTVDALARLTSLYQKDRPAVVVVANDLLAEDGINILLTEAGDDIITET